MYSLTLITLALGFFNTVHGQGGEPQCPTCTNPLGCFSGGLRFDELHGTLGGDFPAEVQADISNICNRANGVLLTIEERSWTYCTNWPAQDGTMNRIDWEIRNTGAGAQDRAVEAGLCEEAYNIELGGCPHGSHQIHGNFQYNWDPNAGGCA